LKTVLFTFKLLFSVYANAKTIAKVVKKDETRS
jgi:hypothetical protein